MAEAAQLDCAALGLTLTAIVEVDASCHACLLHDANVRSFTTRIVLDAAKRAGGLAIPPD